MNAVTANLFNCERIDIIIIACVLGSFVYSQRQINCHFNKQAEVQVNACVSILTTTALTLFPIVIISF